ncbi:MAG: hypothetical protein ING29_06435 [Azospirillum sp.]|nr:hypothetical protein [Azospirillum sp.]
MEEAASAINMASQAPSDAGASSKVRNPILPTGRTVDVPRQAGVGAAQAATLTATEVNAEIPQTDAARPTNSAAADILRRAVDGQVSEAKELAQAVKKFVDDVNTRYGELRKEPPSEKTLAEYAMVRRRALKNGVFDITRYTNSNTKQKVRASFVWLALDHAESAIEKAKDSWKRRAFAEAIQFMLSVLQVRDILAEFDEADPLSNGDENTQKRDSKRKVLTKLPAGWEKTFVEAIRQHSPQWHYATCVMLAVGARPSEVHKGAIVGLCLNGHLFIKVQSAKQGSRGDRSVGVRTIEVKNDVIWTETLAEVVRKNDGQPITVSSPDPKHASQYFSLVSRECGFPVNASVVPYVLRHRFGALIKASGLPVSVQSAAMGHGSTQALSNYGVYNNRISRGGMPVRVECERQPRLIARKSEIPRKLRKLPKLDME